MFFILSPTAFRNVFRRPVTRLYPKTPYHAVAATRGSIRIEYETCNFCTLCEKRCPANAIRMDRPGKVWEIDRLRCIVCGYCVEICPKDCLFLDERYSAPLLATEKNTSREIHSPETESAETSAAR